MKRPFPDAWYGAERQRHVSAVAEVLRRHFPALPERRATFQAMGICSALDDVPYSAPDKSRDAAALARLQAATEEFRDALAALTPWSRQAVDTAAWEIRGAECGIDAEIAVEEVAAHGGAVVARAAEILSGGVSVRRNMRAALVTRELRRAWQADSGEARPRTSVSSQKNSDFRDFLAAAFDALGVGADPRSALQSLIDAEKKGQI